MKKLKVWMKYYTSQCNFVNNCRFKGDHDIEIKYLPMSGQR